MSHFNAKIQEVYNPGKNISVDEGMIGFKGRLSFRQYMPAKPTKYGIKVWMAADASNGFVTNHEVYLGKQRGRVLANGFGYSIVMELMNPFLNKNHHVYFDNFFSSPKLLDQSENRKRTMKAASVEATTTPENAPGHFIIRREGNARKTEERPQVIERRRPSILTINSRFCDNKTSVNIFFIHICLCCEEDKYFS